MGFDVNRFQREYKKMAARNRELEEKLESAEASKAVAVRNACEAAVLPLNDRIRELKQDVRTTQVELGNRLDVIANLYTEIEERDARIADLHKMFSQAVADRDHWKAEHDAQLPAVIAAESKVQDLSKLLEGVRARMRRRELDAEKAILNRSAIRQVAPAPNRR